MLANNVCVKMSELAAQGIQMECMILEMILT